MDATKEQTAPVTEFKAPARDMELVLAEAQSLNRHLLEKISKAAEAVRRDQPTLALEILAG
jgi:hypothetical protein